MAVIELDISRPWPPSTVPHQRSPVALVAIVLAVVLAALTGPSLTGSTPVRPVWQAPAFNGFFWLTPRAAYTIERSYAGLSLSARDPRDGDVRWTVPLSGPIAAGYFREWEALVSRFPPTPDLGTTTLVLDTRNGQVVRGYPAAAMPLVYLADEVALLIDRDPAGGPEPVLPDLTLDPAGLDRPHLVTAIDVATGRVRWTRLLPPGTRWSLPGVRAGTEGVAALPSGQNWLAAITRAGEIAVWDLATGRDVAQRDVGRLGPEGYVAALATMVVARTDTGDSATITGYEGTTLIQRWQLTPPPVYATPLQCGARLCLETDRSVWAVDPGTGVVAWRQESAHLRQAVTGPLVPEFGRQLALVDPVRGQRLPVDDGWRVVDAASYGRLVVLAKREPRDAAVIGLLDLDTGTVTALGRVSRLALADQCLATKGRGGTTVACGDGPAVQVWRAG